MIQLEMLHLEMNLRGVLFGSGVNNDDICFYGTLRNNGVRRIRTRGGMN